MLSVLWCLSGENVNTFSFWLKSVVAYVGYIKCSHTFAVAFSMGDTIRVCRLLAIPVFLKSR